MKQKNYRIKKIKSMLPALGIIIIALIIFLCLYNM